MMISVFRHLDACAERDVKALEPASASRTQKKEEKSGRSERCEGSVSRTMMEERIESVGRGRRGKTLYEGVKRRIVHCRPLTWHPPRRNAPTRRNTIKGSKLDYSQRKRGQTMDHEGHDWWHQQLDWC